MPNTESWLSIYRSIGIKPDKEYLSLHLSENIGVLIRKGPRDVQYFNVPRFGIQDEENVYFKFRQDIVHLDPGFFYTILEMKGNFEDRNELRRAQESCSEIFGMLALLYGPGILEKKYFEGFKFTPSIQKFEGPYSLLYETEVIESDFISSLRSVFKTFQQHKEKAKLEIALRWYQAGLDSWQPTDQMLYYWISLEALTMTKTNIDEIPKTLKRFLPTTDEKLIQTH